MDGEKDNSQNTSEIETFDDGYLPPDAKPLCPRCLQPCHPLQYYCTNCGCNEAINPLTTYMPYIRIRFNIGIFIKLCYLVFGSRTTLLLRVIYVVIAAIWVLYFIH
jgi:hypothetical protein